MSTPRPHARACGGALALAAVLCAATGIGRPAAAQTLARPGWAGSGLTAEPWWHSAIFYRIDPRGFQDSDGNGSGDLRGVMQRLDYLQALGIDAIVLQAPFDPTGFDDLLSEASRHHIRVVVEVKPSVATGAPSAVLAAQTAEARAWLARGAAGIETANGVALDRAITARAPGVRLFHALRTVTNSFPGERILLTGMSPGDLAPQHVSAAEGPQLTEESLHSATDSAPGLCFALNDAQTPPFGSPLLETGRTTQAASVRQSPEEALGRRKIYATLLLASGDAVALAYGQELGLDDPESRPGAAVPLTMQWTPSDVTPPPPTPHGPAKPAATIYGAFQAYIPPPPTRLLGPPPHAPEIVIADTIAPAPKDPNSLRGFTTGALPPGGRAPNAATANVALESGDPESLLNFYRHLAQLRHGNATLRTGSLYMLEPETPGALVWFRRAPTGARTVASMVIVCNLSGQPLTISVNRDLENLRIRPGMLRPLLASNPEDKRHQETGRLTVAPWGVYIGELYRR